MSDPTWADEKIGAAVTVPLEFPGDDTHTEVLSSPEPVTQWIAPDESIARRSAASPKPVEPASASDAEEITAGDLESATEFPDPPTTIETGTGAWSRHSGILIGRQLLVWIRDPGTLLQSIFFPALSMVMFKVVLGDTVGQATGQNSAFGTVPLVILIGAMFGSMAGAVRLSMERRTGLLARLYVLPIHRGADLTSRIVAELARIAITTIVLVVVGFAIGFRLNQGVLPAIGIVLVALLYGAAFSTMTLALAVNSSKLPLVPLLSLVSSLLMFFNSGFAPIESFPTWLHSVVREQPMTCAIEVMRSLSAGGPITENLAKTAIWAVVVFAIFCYPALIGYRRAATARD